MKLLITADRHQFILNRVRKIKGEDVKIPLGHYTTVETLVKGLIKHELKSKVPAKGWSPAQLTAALGMFQATLATTLSTLEDSR